MIQNQRTIVIVLEGTSIVEDEASRSKFADGPSDFPQFLLEFQTRMGVDAGICLCNVSLVPVE